MTPEQLQELDEAANLATVGPWKPSKAACGALMKVEGGLGKNIADVRYTNGLADARFIALANPQAVLELIAEIRKELK